MTFLFPNLNIKVLNDIMTGISFWVLPWGWLLYILTYKSQSCHTGVIGTAWWDNNLALQNAQLLTGKKFFWRT